PVLDAFDRGGTGEQVDRVADHRRRLKLERLGRRHVRRAAGIVLVILQRIRLRGRRRRVPAGRDARNRGVGGTHFHVRQDGIVGGGVPLTVAILLAERLGRTGVVRDDG